MAKLSEAQEREINILSVLADADVDFAYHGFDVLSRRTQTSRRQVRLDVRRMARKGLVQFAKGLWDDEGEPVGSGYAITDAGRRVWNEFRAKQNAI